MFAGCWDQRFGNDFAGMEADDRTDLIVISPAPQRYSFGKNVPWMVSRNSSTAEDRVTFLSKRIGR
ncbi:MAG: hypothetical protein CML31_05430 [Rhizobiales bacterium]|nr:hypothetical protein [Hoeflea sp.]MBG19395.1 hypothetical protein [Hyphomicrobiales bacterium]